MDLNPYIPIGILVVMAIIFAVANLGITHVLGPRKHGPIKDIPYESGMNPVGTARKKFNVRFYIVAVTFLVFDVEIIFLYPWAVTFTKLEPQSPEAAAARHAPLHHPPLRCGRARGVSHRRSVRRRPPG